MNTVSVKKPYNFKLFSFVKYQFLELNSTYRDQQYMRITYFGVSKGILSESCLAILSIS